MKKKAEIENEILKYKEDTSKVRMKKNTLRKELLFSILILISFIILFTKNISIAPATKIILDFICYTVFSIVLFREIYNEFNDTYDKGDINRLKKFKVLFIGYIFLFAIIATVLFYGRVIDVFF